MFERNRETDSIWSIASIVTLISTLIIAITWFYTEPGYEQLLAIISGLAVSATLQKVELSRSWDISIAVLVLAVAFWGCWFIVFQSPNSTSLTNSDSYIFGIGNPTTSTQSTDTSQNSVSVNQSDGGENSVSINQSGGSNSAVVNQSGSNNQATINQNGSSNSAAISQTSEDVAAINVVSETRELIDFTRIHLQTGGELILSQGDSVSVIIEAPENILPLISTEVRGESLFISTVPSSQVLINSPVRYLLSMPNINAISCSSSANIYSDGIDAETLELTLSGSGDINIQSVNANTILTNIEGSGDLEIQTGNVVEQRININGSGKYIATGLRSEKGIITNSGSGDASAWIDNLLQVTINGSGDVNYFGNPEIYQVINGSGDVNWLGSR